MQKTDMMAKSIDRVSLRGMRWLKRVDTFCRCIKPFFFFLRDTDTFDKGFMIVNNKGGKSCRARSGSLFTNHSREHSLSFSPAFCKFECNTTSDWLNRMVCQ